MTNGNAPAASVPQPGREWDEDLIYQVLAERSRRLILLTLAREGPKTAAELQGHARSHCSSSRANLILKHLAVLRAPGLVLMQENPRDGRKALYGLSPAVPVTRTENSATLNFGFCTIKL